MDKIGAITTNYMISGKSAMNKTSSKISAVPQDKVSSGLSQTETVNNGKLAKIKNAVKNAGVKAGRALNGAGSFVKSGLLTASSIALTVGCIGLFAGHGVLKLADKVNNLGTKAGGEKIGNALSKITGENEMTKVTGKAAAAAGAAAVIGAGSALLLGGPVGFAAFTAGTTAFGAGFLGGAYSAAEKK